MSNASIVYASLGRMLLDPPGKIIYHRIDPRRADWPRWPENPERPGTAMRVGHEVQMTHCARLIYRSLDSDKVPSGITTVHRMDGIRLDHARLIGRPCRVCFDE